MGTVKTLKRTVNQLISSKGESELADKVGRALQLQKVIKKCQTELKALQLDFDEIMSGTGQTVIATSQGCALRTVSNSYSIDDSRIEELGIIFAKAKRGDIAKYVKMTEKVNYACTADMRKILLDDTFPKISKLREIVSIKTTYAIKFEPNDLSKN
jgi:hypothetical protein